MLKTRFSREAISKILDQSISYQCACPAQVCALINEQRKLFAYQNTCLNLTGVERLVHQHIADSVRITHNEMENCLAEVLKLEGWNMTTFEMPESLKTKILAQIPQYVSLPTLSQTDVLRD
jgi:hypothetical protein